MRLTVIVSDFGAAANIGGAVETQAKIFEMPADIAAYIKSNRGKWTSIALAFEDEAAQEQGGSDANGNR